MVVLLLLLVVVVVAVVVVVVGVVVGRCRGRCCNLLLLLLLSSPVGFLWPPKKSRKTIYCTVLLRLFKVPSKAALPCLLGGSA